MSEMDGRHDEELLARAKIAFEKAYAPYSKFSVGAALMTKDGTIFHGGKSSKEIFHRRQ